MSATTVSRTVDRPLRAMVPDPTFVPGGAYWNMAGAIMGAAEDERWWLEMAENGAETNEERWEKMYEDTMREDAEGAP